MIFTVYSNRGQERSVLEKVRFQWIRSVLEQTGIDWEDCFPEDDDPNSVTIDQKIKTRKISKDNKIAVVDDNDDGVKIYVTNEVIAEWKKPIFKMHHDPSQIERENKWYVSIDIECWSVFDEETENKDE